MMLKRRCAAHEPVSIWSAMVFAVPDKGEPAIAPTRWASCAPSACRGQRRRPAAARPLFEALVFGGSAATGRRDRSWMPSGPEYHGERAMALSYAPCCRALARFSLASSSLSPTTTKGAGQDFQVLGVAPTFSMRPLMSA